ncbi:MAG: DUF898 domain-containing protein [Gammaproteobacteria bacterium]|nr:DUF898 domain-containing protein [Gammaproteobacteria bacterium]
MASTPEQKRTHIFEFRGRGGEYFKIWIVNILLSILTLYIYSAWAKVRTNRYFYGNTYLADGSFEYHATPMQILKGRIIAVILLIIFVVANVIHPLASIILAGLMLLATPWIVWRSMIFNARMTSYRNVRFNFVGTCGSMYLYILVIPMIPIVIGLILAAVMYFNGNTALLPGIVAIAIIIAYLMYPLTRRLLSSYAIDNAKYGTSEFKSRLTTGNFYKIYLKMIGLSILVYIGVVLLVMLLGFLAQILGFIDGEGFMDMVDMDPDALVGSGAMIPVFVLGGLFYIGIIVVGILIAAYLLSRMRNYIFSNTVLADKVELMSFLPARGLWWLMTTNFLLVVFTLGLAYPWAKVRSARYYARHTSVSADSLDGFISEQVNYQSSLGDEIGDAFDVDIGLGI